MKLIDKDTLIIELEKRKKQHEEWKNLCKGINSLIASMLIQEYINILSFLDTLEVKEVNLEKLGEIARHLIAVKEHIEDMRLDKDEWSILEKLVIQKDLKHRKEKRYASNKLYCSMCSYYLHYISNNSIYKRFMGVKTLNTL